MNGETLALLHHLTVDLLRESFYSLKRKAAPGVDGVTWQEYEDGLEDRLTTLRRRSQKHPISWESTLALAKRWLPQPRVLHPYPAMRFAACYPR